MNEPHKNSANYHNLNKYLDPRLTDSLNQSGLRLNLDIDFGNQTIDIAGQLALELSAKEEHEATVTAEDWANLSRIPHDYGQPEKQQSADEAMEIQQENMGCAGEEPAKVKTPKPQKPNSVADTDLGRRKTIAAALNPLAPPSLGFLCQHCPKSFTTSRGLIAHNARIHRFLCPHCPKTYRISRSMKGHIAQMHKEKAQQEHKETRQQQPRAAVHIHANAPQALPLAAQGPSVSLSVTSAAADPATYCELCHKQCRSANGFKLHQKGWEHVKKALAAV